MKFFKYTNKGPRKINEDSLHVSYHNSNIIFACIADGVGGLKHGDFASDFVVNEFVKYCNETSNPNLGLFLSKANQDLIRLARTKFDTDIIATTFTGGIITKTNFYGVHVGDSRACILRGNGIKQLTAENNEIGRLIKEGKVKSSDRKYYPRRNVIENILGSEELFNLQELNFGLLANDRIIISTDGFHDSITKKELRDLSIKIKSTEEFERRLIIELENRILHDNCTFICIEI